MLWLDRETFSDLDLKEVGTYRYAENAEDLLISYAVGDGPVAVWDCTAEECHDELWHALEDQHEVWAHNAAFDKAIHNNSATARLLPRVALERWRCSMAMALSHALPAALSDLCEVLRVPEDKSKLAEGKKLVQKFTRPHVRRVKGEVRRTVYNRLTSPEEWERFKLYAANDIEAVRECVKRMPRWNWDASAIAEWHCDQRINERGFQVDRELTRAGARAAVDEKERIGVRFRELTAGVVERPSQREQFRVYLNERFGLGLEDTKSDTFLQLLKADTLPESAREMMTLSIASNKTSTAKYAALEPAVQSDNRFRGGLQFAGASRTRRWAGRLFQPQNLPSRGLPDAEDVEFYIECLKTGSHDLFFDELMRYGAAALRGIVIAPPEKKLAVADLSNIEGRMLAWVSGEAWKLKAFREFDAGTGADLYNITATSIIGGDPWKVEKKNRNVFGKVPDLACLAADTRVLTDRGLVAIAEVSAADKVWDGQEWVQHEGLVERGVRPVVRVDGIEATPDHLIDTQGTWRPARELATCDDTLNRALATGSESFASLVWREAPQGASAVSWCAALAAASNELSKRTFGSGVRRAATPAPSGPQQTPGSTTGVTRLCARTRNTGVAYSTASRLLSTVAETRTTLPIRTTEVAGFECSRSGSKTEPSSCDTCCCCPDGIAPILDSTESTLTEATSQATCASRREARTDEISEASKPCNSASPNPKPVFDLLNCGPRNRFTIKTDSGWLVVHNCGYMGGVAGFQTFARSYNVRMADYWDVMSRSIDPQHIIKARENFAKWGRQQATDMEISELEWIASETCKLAWRARHPATKRFWYALQDAAKNAIENWDVIYPVGQFIKVRGVTQRGQRWLLVRLPSGRLLTYFDPQLIDDSITYMGEAAEEGKTSRHWTRIWTHGGKMTGNVCQTLARDILAPTLLTAEQRGYIPVLTVHDEVLTEVPDTDEFDAEGLTRILATNPEWSAGLPLAAAGFCAMRYRKE